MIYQTLIQRFQRTLERELLAAGLSKYHQCGVCTATCPVRQIEEKFNPRRIMKLAKLGLKELVLEDEFIWLCSMCFMCEERCPQDVRPPDVMTVLRNIAARENRIPVNVAKLMEILAENGRIYPLDDFALELREEDELPGIKSESKFIKKIAEA